MAVVSQQIRLHRTGAGRIGSSVLFLAILAAAPAALGLARLLPPDAAGLALRLSAASCCVLLVPGAIVVRALGPPAALGVAVAASLAWSLALLAGALALTFAFNGSIETTLWLVAAAAVAALVPALARAPVASERSERLALLGVLAAGVAFAGAVWWAADTIQGDGLFHLGRVRKLETLHLSSVNVVDEFRDGGLHPGYAFPLWHAALALVARLAGVDPAVAVQHAPAVLTPLALVLAYAAGAAVFRSYGGGIAVAGAQAGLLGFSRAGTGSFDFLALPPAVARALLAPALLALVFSLAARGHRRHLLSIAAASLGLAIVHPTYAFFVALPLAGFLLARLALAPHRWREALRIAATLPAVLLPAGLYALWLRPIVDKTVSHDPNAAERARGVIHYAGQIDVVGGSFRLSPDLISRGGAVTVAGLLAIPLAGLAGGRRWAAYVLGASLAILPVVLLPFAFTELSDAVSLSQSRRLIAFLPIPFAVAGVASLLGRLRLAGCLAAFAAGGALQLLYPGEFTYRLILGGPAWTVWVAIAGAAAALIASAVVRKTLVHSGPAWTAAVALAFVVPIAGAGFINLRRDEPAPIQLTPGLVHALRTDVGKRDVVFSDLATSYRIAAYAPVYVAAAPPAHVADTEDNRPYERRMDVIEFFRTGDLAIPRRYRAGWIVVARRRFKLELPMRPVYEDERFALFRLRANS